MRRFVGGVGGRAGPGEDLLQGRPVGPDAGLADPPGQAGQAVGEDRGGRAELPGDQERRLGVEDIVEHVGVSWHNHIEMLEDLAAERRRLVDQVAAVAGQELDPGIVRLGGGIEQAEAVDRGAMDGRQVGVVGLVAGIGGLAELLGGRRGGPGGPRTSRSSQARWTGRWYRPVCSMATMRSARPCRATASRIVRAMACEARPGVLDDGRGDEDAAVEVGEHPLGAGLGAVDGDDAEVLRPDGLDPGVDRAEGLVDDLGAGRLA